MKKILLIVLMTFASMPLTVDAADVDPSTYVTTLFSDIQQLQKILNSLEKNTERRIEVESAMEKLESAVEMILHGAEPADAVILDLVAPAQQLLAAQSDPMQTVSSADRVLTEIQQILQQLSGKPEAEHFVEALEDVSLSLKRRLMEPSNHALQGLLANARSFLQQQMGDRPLFAAIAAFAEKSFTDLTPSEKHEVNRLVTTILDSYEADHTHGTGPLASAIRQLQTARFYIEEKVPGSEKSIYDAIIAFYNALGHTQPSSSSAASSSSSVASSYGAGSYAVSSPIASSSSSYSVSSPLNVTYGISGRWGNKRSPMEDYADVLQQRSKLLIGVYDGHGGLSCAHSLKENQPSLLERLANAPQSSDPFTPVFRETDEAWFASEHGITTSGSTATVAQIETTGTPMLTLAWVGDSRAVLGNKDGTVAFATRDHNPDEDNPDEVARIIQAGGIVIGNRVGSRLAVSRAFGDRISPDQPKLSGLTVDPEIKTISLTDDSDILIIASDGLWDTISSEEAIQTAQAFLRENASSGLTPDSANVKFEEGNNDQLILAARHLRDMAKSRNTLAGNQPNNDDITVAIAKFR